MRRLFGQGYDIPIRIGGFGVPGGFGGFGVPGGPSNRPNQSVQVVINNPSMRSPQDVRDMTRQVAMELPKYLGLIGA